MAIAENTAASDIALQSFLNGVNAPQIADRIATIVGTASLIRFHPFPTFVNTMVVNLASVFADKHSNNALRLVVARVLSESQNELSLVFSGQVVMDKILVVATSNDSEARALTMQVLASLAPVAPNNKQVHHLIVEELSASNNFEFQSACMALAAYSSLSTEFCNCAMEQLSELLLSPTTVLERKRQLIPVMGKMRANLETTQAAFALGTRLLRGNMLQPELISSMFDSLTQLAMTTRFSIPDQLTLLLSELRRASDTTSLALFALHNIRKLASHAHMWDEEHLKGLLECRDTCEAASTLCLAYLDVFVVLSQRALPSHSQFFKEFLSDFAALYSASDIHVRVKFLQVSTNIFMNVPSDMHSSILLTSFVSTIPMQIDHKLARKMYSMCSQFLTHDMIGNGVWDAVSVCTSLPSTHAHLSLVIEMLANLADSNQQLCASLSKWASAILSNKEVCNRLPISVLSFLVLSGDDPLGVADIWRDDDAMRYQIARVALRTGHWKDVALPLLSEIDNSTLSLESLSWIQTLAAVSGGQPTEFTLVELQRDNDALRDAECISKRLVVGAHSSSFVFPSRYITAMLASSTAFLHILRGLGNFFHLNSQFGTKATSVRIVHLLESCLSSVRISVDAWVYLGRTCFTADQRSLDLIHLLHAQMSILNYGITCLTSTEIPAPVVVPVLSNQRASLSRFHTLLTWANTQIEQLGRSAAHGNHRVTEQTMNLFFGVMKALYFRKVELPRFFFEQKYNTSIRLSVTPGKNGEHHSLANRPEPITVDGVISSNHPASITHLIVSAHIKFVTSPARDFVQSQTVTPHDEKYFSAKFLITFPQTCSVYFCVEFVDSERRIAWMSEARSSLTIKVNE